MFNKDFGLDLITKNFVYRVIAFDSKRGLLLVEQMYNDTLKPFKVIVNPSFIVFEAELHYDEIHSFQDLEIAYNYYDTFVLVSDTVV